MKIFNIYLNVLLKSGSMQIKNAAIFRQWLKMAAGWLPLINHTLTTKINLNFVGLVYNKQDCIFVCNWWCINIQNLVYANLARKRFGICKVCSISLLHMLYTQPLLYSPIQMSQVLFVFFLLVLIPKNWHGKFLSLLWC